MTTLLDHYREVAAAAAEAEEAEAALSRQPTEDQHIGVIAQLQEKHVGLLAQLQEKPPVPSPPRLSPPPSPERSTARVPAEPCTAPDPVAAELNFELEQPTAEPDTEEEASRAEEDEPAASAGLWPGLEEAERFAAGLLPTEAFADRQRCAHELACRLARNDVEALLPLLGNVVPGLLSLAAEAEAAADGLTLGVVLSALTNMGFGAGTAVVMRHGDEVGALLARTIAAEAAPACGYALACASNLTAQPALRRALEAAPGAEAALRRTARQTHGVADARYAKMVLDGLQKQRGVGAPLRPQSAAARPQSARPQLAHGKENSGSLRVLQSPRLQATVRRVSSFGRSRRPQLSASPMPQPFDLLAGSAV